jgi:P-type conjugative transfer protein TrbJ
MGQSPMKKMEECVMKQIFLLIAVFYVFFLLTGTARAGGGLTGGATEFTQIANNSELLTQVSQLAEQIEQQIQMAQDMIHNTLNLPGKLMGNVTGMFNTVMNAYNRAQGILNRLSNLDEEFYNKFYSSVSDLTNPSSWVKNYSAEYFKLSEGMEKEAQRTAESLKVSADDITDSGELLEKLAENASSAEGRNAILQASNEFLGFIGGELVKTRTLLAEQMKSYLDYAERRRTLEDAAADVLKRDIENWQSPEKTHVEFDW